MREGVIACVLTLNFDLAMASAVAALGCGDQIAVIHGPDDHADLGSVSIIYLHRSALADPDAWILRHAPIEETWHGDWREIITARVLSSPFVVFAGLGSPASVLIETIKNIREIIPNGIHAFQVDIVEPANSAFFQELNLPDNAYIRSGWNEFMKEVADKVVREHVRQLLEEADRLRREEHYPTENLDGLRDQLVNIGLLNLGRLRSIWLLKKTQYVPQSDASKTFVADLLLGIAMLERQTGCLAVFSQNDVVELRRGAHVIASVIIASGRGEKTWMSMEIAARSRHKTCASNTPKPVAVLFAGVQGGRPNATLPEDILGSRDTNDIISGDSVVKMFSFLELRQDPNLIGGIVAA